MTTLSDKEVAALAAYSEGRSGWRGACRALRLMDIDELHALLELHGLPVPAADDSPPDEETAARFSAFLRGDGNGA